MSIEADSLQNTFDISDEIARIKKAAEAIRCRTSIQPQMLVVLGSGLNTMADAVREPVSIPFGDLPGFPRATVPGHAGRLVLGYWGKKPVAVMQGRFHYYEGHSMQAVVRPIRVMCELGVRSLILTNAAGGLDQDMTPGDLMLISDHLGFYCEPPLRGPNYDDFGPRFADQSHVYDPAWQASALRCAAKLEIPLRSGVYAYSKGPQFETPAEIRALRLLGANAVGMSTVPEAIVASHAGLQVLAISCITNMAAGILDQPLSHAEVMDVGAKVAERTIRLLSAIIDQIE